MNPHPFEEADPAFIPPSDRNVQVWRYIDFPKYVDLLERKQLYFSRADRLGDPFEGSIPQMTAEGRRHFYEDLARRAGVPGTAALGYGVEELSETTRLAREWTYINCWHMNEHESAAMWKLYAEQGIAIQSTYAKLRSCLPYGTKPDEPWVCVGTVAYINYETAGIPDGHLLTPFMHKRGSFAHERELRALIFDLPGMRRAGQPQAPAPPNGMHVAVDLQQLVDRIFVAPQSPAWLRELVQKVSERYGLGRPVEPSGLDKRALF